MSRPSIPRGTLCAVCQKRPVATSRQTPVCRMCKEDRINAGKRAKRAEKALMVCDTCHKELQVGDFPFCPHGRGVNAIEPDDVPGGFVVENGFDTPQRFYSHSAHEKALAEKGLEIRAKYAGPNDKHLKPWNAPSAKTLRDAEILLARGATARAEAIRERKARVAAEFPITVEAIRV